MENAPGVVAQFIELFSRGTGKTPVPRVSNPLLLHLRMRLFSGERQGYRIGNSNMKESLENYLNDLLNPQKDIIARRLSTLSYLAPEELLLFKKKLREAPLKRKLQVLDRLILISADNASLNFDEVFSFCLTDNSPEVRLKALEALEGTEETFVVRQVVKMLSEDVDEAVRTSACSFLAPIALKVELNELPESLAHQVETALWSAWENENSSVDCKCCALESLSYINKHHILKAIEKAYHAENKQMKVSSLVGMGRSFDSRWIPLITQELNNPDEIIRIAAVQACGEMAQEFFVPYLVPLLEAPEPIIKFATIISLGHIGGSIAEEKLRSLTKSDEPEIRDAAIDALQEIIPTRDLLHMPILD